jgi:CysZ protein
VLFAALFSLALYSVHHLLAGHSGSGFAASLLASIFLLVIVTLLGAPVAALFAGLFLEDIAKAVEAKYYPAGPHGEAVPFWQGLFLGLRLFLLLLVIAIVMLPISALLPGVGSLPAIIVNGWFLGRQYFEQVALRHRSLADADALRRRKLPGIAGDGLLIALLAAIPVVNLFAPLFGTALMVHEFNRYMREEQLA